MPESHDEQLLATLSNLLKKRSDSEREVAASQK